MTYRALSSARLVDGMGDAGSNIEVPVAERTIANPKLENTPFVGRQLLSSGSEKCLEMAEERTRRLIACIQPTQEAEAKRKAITRFVKSLINKCLDCQVLGNFSRLKMENQNLFF